MSVVAARSLPLNPGAESFVSSRSGSEASSPARCSSPEAPERGPIEARPAPQSASHPSPLGRAAPCPARCALLVCKIAG